MPGELVRAPSPGRRQAPARCHAPTDAHRASASADLDRAGELDRAATLTVSGVPAGCPVTDAADKSRRFVLTGKDLEGRNRTILWREVDLIGGTVVRRVVITVDATMTTATVLTCAQAVAVAQAILEAAR